jgi:hypothetical protein
MLMQIGFASGSAATAGAGKLQTEELVTADYADERRFHDKANRTRTEWETI